jgi:hypothetical protein
VLRDQRLAGTEGVDELADRALAVPQQRQDLPAGRLGEDGEEHRLLMSRRSYNRQGT